MKTNHKHTVRLLIEEVFNKGNLSVLEELIHSDYRYQSPTETMEGIEDLRAFVLGLRNAFPDLHVCVNDQIAEDEKVSTKITLTGTHAGDFLGLLATGKSVELQGVILSRLEDGLIREEWELLDQLSLLQQLGIAEKA
jgi:steroid delta-isomerase-like uncharacterized protein